MKKIYSLILSLTIFAASQAQTTLTQWNFDSSSTAPSTGSGTLSLVGGTTASATAFPAGNPGSGQSYSITAFPAQNTASGTAGYQFAVNTTGFNGITVTMDISGTNPSSKWLRYEYTIDGSNWLVLGNNTGDLTTAFALKSLSLPASCNNNPNFAFRIVSLFRQANNDRYDSIQAGNNYLPTGSWQIDNVTFSYNVLSMKENSITGLKIYPNPAKNNLYVTSDNFDEKNIEIYNVLGKIVLSTKVINAPVNVSKLSNGVYIVKVTENKKTSTRKLVIE